MNRHSERKKVHQLGGPQNRRALPSSDLLVESVSQSVSQSVSHTELTALASKRPYCRCQILEISWRSLRALPHGLVVASPQRSGINSSFFGPSGRMVGPTVVPGYGPRRGAGQGRAGQRREMGGAVSSIRLIAGPNRRAALQFLGRLLHVTQPAHCLDRDSARHRKEVGLL
ncbi:hypothetical protein MPTK1_4g06810 [Marchantia polymorpha subsp. ruderalis]|uniref:Uncharacterized protein n=2 Tax=Marchantia polymorpha TaxID=3197 RepID=A0AAF6B759_MARPO|nr:hypothetical protein MARPO_0125s0026 [Marchantia polymorpha]BBN07843.1 hypothetical protein Mp_4g06810 [Marchantia polymorpha subsp. ruderalis]|eukprot:PTQ30377.1 hypothetical protein MARPO_0125s0026 [Marchantia polymorpha]